MLWAVLCAAVVQGSLLDLNQLGTVVKFTDTVGPYEVGLGNGTYRPVVQMHGMGDYAANPLGMVPLKKLIAKHLGTYVTNIALGKTASADQMSEFFTVMQGEVDKFAEAVRKDTNLAKGFNAVGYSQGNLIIRGYVEQYNDPPVYNFVSIHGPMMGVAGFPHCNYSASVCKAFDNLLGDAAYTPMAQDVLAQANYLRDPKRIPAYLKGDHWLVVVNNERGDNKTFNANLNKLESIGMVKALKDTMVIPNDSEWWGFYKDGDEKTILKMNETKWYKEDSFGLKTLNEAGKMKFYTTPGDHLKFTEAFLLKMVDAYFRN